MENIVTLANQSKVLWGVSMLMLNLGARYVIMDLGKAHEIIFSSEIVKKMIVLSMFFMATRDILMSFLLTVAYVIIMDGMLHENGRLCVLPKSIAHRARKASVSTDIVEQYHQPKKNTYSSYLTNIKQTQI